jgi:hypothetical protein
MDNPESLLALPENPEPGVVYDHEGIPMGTFSQHDSASEGPGSLTDGLCDSEGDSEEDGCSDASISLSADEVIAYMNAQPEGQRYTLQALEQVSADMIEHKEKKKMVKEARKGLVHLGKGRYFGEDEEFVFEVVDVEYAGGGLYDEDRREKYGLPEGKGTRALDWQPHRIRKALEKVGAEVPERLAECWCCGR